MKIARMRETGITPTMWCRDERGDYVPLPLDADAQDAAIRRALALQMKTAWPMMTDADREAYTHRYRAFVAALALAISGDSND